MPAQHGTTPPDDDILVDRERELGQLRGLLDRPGPQLALVYGRRQVGKTYLLTRTWPDAESFYFVAAETTGAVNRQELLAAAGRHFGLTLEPADYPTWRAVFRLLYELQTPEPLAIVLDEFQYLMGAPDSVPSELNAVHDIHRDRRPFVLVLSGSAVRTMEHLNAADAPLYGRFSRAIRLEPFDYYDAAAMTPFAAARDRARAYGIVGGTPRYLDALRERRSLGDSVAAEVLAPGGRVRLQVETLIDQERGLRNADAYKAILRAIGSGLPKAQAIADFTGLKNDFAFKRMLEKLIDLGYVRPERSYAAQPNRPVNYRLADPALRFHNALVEPFRSELATADPNEVWRREIIPRLDTYMGGGFEDIAHQAYLRHRQRLDLPMVETWSRWEGTVRPDRGRGQPQSIEVDIVARLTDGRMLTGAVTWGHLDLGVHAKHLRDLAVLAAAGHDWARQALEPDAPVLYVAGGRVPAEFRKRAEIGDHSVTVWTLDDLYHGLGRPAR